MVSRTRSSASSQWIAVPVFLTGAAVAVVLGVLGTKYWPGSQPLPTWGFSGPESFKSYLSSLVLLLIIGQLITAIWIYRWRAGRVVHIYHRSAGTVAFILSLPVGFYCLYTFGFRVGNDDMPLRTVVHSYLGAAFYGAFAAKMLTLRLRRAPAWLLPTLGGLVFGTFVIAWALASGWWFGVNGFAR